MIFVGHFSHLKLKSTTAIIVAFQISEILVAAELIAEAILAVVRMVETSTRGSMNCKMIVLRIALDLDTVSKSQTRTS